jgi:uncharacterized membrane protein
MLKQKPHATLVPTMYSKKRLEALSDGIFAIAMTLLVLELKVPTDFAHGQLWQALRLESNDWLAFLITFCIAARYWMLQHNVFMLTENFTHSAVVLTFTFLGLITILPFSSSLMGRYASEPLAFCLYCANQSAIGGVLIAKLEFLRIREHLKKSAEMQHVRSDSLRLDPSCMHADPRPPVALQEISGLNPQNLSPTTKRLSHLWKSLPASYFASYALPANCRSTYCRIPPCW